MIVFVSHSHLRYGPGVRAMHTSLVAVGAGSTLDVADGASLIVAFQPAVRKRRINRRTSAAVMPRKRRAPPEA